MQIMTNYDYQPPVDRLLTLGDARNSASEWSNYLAFGLTPEHIPELVRMALDQQLNTARADTLEVWAPIHAMRALGQLHAAAAVEPLIPLLDDTEVDDSLFEELPDVFGEIGPAAIPALSLYLRDRADKSFPRVIATAEALGQIAQKNPEHRQTVVDVLTEQLARPDQDDGGINGFLIDKLIDLKAKESAAAIKAAFYARRVDPTIVGDWYAVRDDLGLEPSAEVLGPDPLHETRLFDPVFSMREHRNPKASHISPKKAKSKRKQEKKSRKQNRKKR